MSYTGSARLATLACLLLSSACAPASDELPVVARGRWVEVATDRDDPICAGTIDFLDGLVGEGFRFLGETPPDDVFIRYEWLKGPLDAGHARKDAEGIVVVTDQLIEEHELAHAVHLTAWPRSARFMEEGLAILLDGRRIYSQYRWPDGYRLDDILEDPLEAGENYSLAWFIVSQIVHDHGVEGLRELWHAVPPGASATEIRAAYEAQFGRSMDVLLEPRPDDDFPDFLEERYPCSMALCPGEPLVLKGDELRIPGPSGCEDDPGAVGPHSRGLTIDGPPVWTHAVVDAGEEGLELVQIDGMHVFLRGCSLECKSWRNFLWVKPIDVDDEWEGASILGRQRIEARRPLEDLPTDDPGALVFREWIP